MKNILLTAKFLAANEQSDKIKIEHIKKALQSLEFTDAEMRVVVRNYLKLPAIEMQQLVTQENLDAIAKQPKISYGEKAKEFVEFLKSQGLTLNKTITKLHYKNPKILYKENAQKLLKLGKIKSTLSEIIYDQDIAIEAVKDVVSKAVFEKKEDAVKAILFFVGPPATGKTFLAEETGKILKEYGYTTKIFNMTMYSDDTSNLTGLKEPYQGAGKGDLSKYIEENPKSLIIFDEIEKCNKQKQYDLFRLLDRGYIEDKFKNETIDAKDCILIFTSNLGKDIYERNDYTSLIQDQKETETLILQSIAKEKSEKDPNTQAIVSPLVSRLGASKIVLFNKVGLKAYFKMAQKEVGRYFGVIEEQFGTKISCSNYALLASFLKYLPFFDLRRVKGKIGDDLFDLIRDYTQENNLSITSFSSIQIKVSGNLETLLEQNFVESFEDFTFKDDRFQELIDKKKTLFTAVKVSIPRGSSKLVIRLSNPEIAKVKNIQDYSGDVKVELDVPSGKIEGEPNAHIFGHEDAKKMLVRIANKIKKFQELQRQNDPKAAQVLKNIPKGILLYGPPGTGKTRLAKAFAAQVEAPIVVTAGKDMTTMQYVGTGVMKIKEIFKKAREYAPSVLFIDEIDAVGKRGDSNGNNDTNINTLLEELDGFKNDLHKPVFVIAATNRKDQIDPAIIRPGRIEEHIEIPSLSKEAREEFLTFMFQDDGDFSNTIDVKKFLKYTVGMTGAQIEMIFKKAKYKLEIEREETNNPKLKIDLDFLIDVTNEVRYGRVNASRADATFKNILTAYHEAGHAVTSLVLNPSIPIEQITITPRADFGGFVSYNHEEVMRWDKQLFRGKIAAAYGGRIAEQMYFEGNSKPNVLGVSAGASQDIKQATNLIRQAVLQLGMDEELGLINYDNLSLLSEVTKQKIDETILKWQNELKQLTRETLEKNWHNIERIVEELVGNDKTEGKETLDSEWLHKNLQLMT